MTIAAAIISVLGALAGVVLTFLTLPGIWLMLLIALLCDLWRPELYSWWALGAVAATAALAEIAEFLAAAAGSSKSGGTRTGAIAAIVGAIAGMIAGTILLPMLPIIGGVLGGIVGAGLGAIAGERAIERRTWSESWKSGRGAMTGRAISIVVKGAFSIVAAAILIAGAIIP